jgi:glycosyltransferase involved in cell wall biosynthesis
MNILFLADFRHWAFDGIAHSIKKRLQKQFTIDIAYTSEKPRLDPKKIDYLYVFFWGETWYQQFDFNTNQVIKEVASWRWSNEDQYGLLKPPELINKYLRDAIVVTTPSRLLFETISPLHPNVIHMPNGVEWRLYSSWLNTRQNQIHGGLKLGWAGNARDACKGVDDIIRPASHGFQLWIAGGSLDREQLLKFYQTIDVLVIASTQESQPLPLLEALASGCFIVTTDVGIVSELKLDHQSLIICERTIKSFREAFEWCEQNLNLLRATRVSRCLDAKGQDWDFFAERFASLFNSLHCASNGIMNASLHSSVDRSIDVMNSASALGQPYPCRTVIRSLILLKEKISRLAWGDRYSMGIAKRVSACLRRFCNAFRFAG